MRPLVVEEEIRVKRLEKGYLLKACEKQRFVDADTPSTQGSDDTLVGWCPAGRDKGRAQRRIFRREQALDLM